MSRKVYKSLDCVCLECLKESKTKVVDEGIGAYEYWGAICIDHDFQVVSVCCGGSAINPVTSLPITMSDMEEDYPDFD